MDQTGAQIIDYLKNLKVCNTSVVEDFFLESLDPNKTYEKILYTDSGKNDDHYEIPKALCEKFNKVNSLIQQISILTAPLKDYHKYLKEYFNSFFKNHECNENIYVEKKTFDLFTEIFTMYFFRGIQDHITIQNDQINELKSLIIESEIIQDLNSITKTIDINKTGSLSQWSSYQSQIDNINNINNINKQNRISGNGKRKRKGKSRKGKRKGKSKKEKGRRKGKKQSSIKKGGGKLTMKHRIYKDDNLLDIDSEIEDAESLSLALQEKYLSKIKDRYPELEITIQDIKSFDVEKVEVDNDAYWVVKNLTSKVVYYGHKEEEIAGVNNMKRTKSKDPEHLEYPYIDNNDYEGINVERVENPTYNDAYPNRSIGFFQSKEEMLKNDDDPYDSGNED